MKLFQQMLVAIASVGLIAPTTAQAADVFNLEGMNSYVRKKSTSRKQKLFNSNSFNNELATQKVESSINKNNKRIKLSDKLFKKRQKLKKIVMNKKLSLEERFKAQQKLSKLPRNSAKVRVMNRCQITGRPHGVYRKLKISRIALRQLGLQGKIPGLVKSSW